MCAAVSVSGRIANSGGVGGRANRVTMRRRALLRPADSWSICGTAAPQSQTKHHSRLQTLSPQDYC